MFMHARGSSRWRRFWWPPGGLLLLSLQLHAAPVIDDQAGLFHDSFSSADTIPGQSLDQGEHVVFDGTPADGRLRLGTPPNLSESGRILQRSWADGAGLDLSEQLEGETGFARESSNVVYDYQPNQLMLVPFVVRQFGTQPDRDKHPVAPIRSDGSVLDYYDYQGASSFAPFPSQSLTSNIYLFQNTDPASLDYGELALVFTHNEYQSTGSASASMYLDIAGCPAGSRVAVSDDPNELQATLGGTGPSTTFAARWRWNQCCSDGGALRLLPTSPNSALDFSIDLRVTGGFSPPSGDTACDPDLPAGQARFSCWIDEYFFVFHSDYFDNNVFLPVRLAQPASVLQVPGEPISLRAATTGLLDSAIFDLGEVTPGGHIRLGSLRFDAQVDPGASLAFRFRAGGDPELDFTDSAPWSAPLSSAADLTGLVGDDQRYLQYRVEMELPDPRDAPAVGLGDELVILYELEVPFVRTFAPVLFPSGTATGVEVRPQPEPFAWQQVGYSGNADRNSDISVDVLDADSLEVLQAAVLPGEELLIDPELHPALRLAALLETANSNAVDAPRIDDWTLEWETDLDADGVGDDSDNCPGTYNPDQSDGDGDGIGDACEGQPDGGPLDSDQPDAALPDAALADGFIGPDATRPDVANPDGFTWPDAARPDVANSDSMGLDAGSVEASSPDHSLPDGPLPDQSGVDTAVTEAGPLDAGSAEGPQPDASGEDVPLDEDGGNPDAGTVDGFGYDRARADAPPEDVEAEDAARDASRRDAHGALVQVAGSGCACGSGPPPTPLGALLLLGLLGLGFSRRRAHASAGQCAARSRGPGRCSLRPR